MEKFNVNDTMTRVFKFFVAAALLALSLTSCREQGKQTTALINVTLVPMTEERVIEHQMVLVEGKRIIAVGSSDEVAIPENATVIDGAGAYLMPGLADMHVHVRDNWPVSPLNLYLANGVTTIRDFGAIRSDMRFVLRWRDEINNGERSGPIIYSCGPVLGGHQSLSTLFDTDDVQEIIRELKDTGYDFVKLYSHPSEETFYELVAAARQHGLYTAGHIPFTVGLDGVLSAGMDEIAHIEELDWELYDFDRDKHLTPQAWDRYIFIDTMAQQAKAFDFDFEAFAEQKREIISKTVEKLRSANIPLDTTLVVSELIVEKLLKPEVFLARPELVYMPSWYLEAFSQGKEKHQQIAAMIGIKGHEGLPAFKYAMDTMWLLELKQAGIPLLLATDAGTGAMGIVPGFSIHEELQILVRNGFTPYEAIATGTVNASEAIEKMTGADDFGTIEVGKRADLILVKENPLKDVANLKAPLGVMAAGRWYSRETLAQMIAFEK